MSSKEEFVIAEDLTYVDQYQRKAAEMRKAILPRRQVQIGDALSGKLLTTRVRAYSQPDQIPVYDSATLSRVHTEHQKMPFPQLRDMLMEEDIPYGLSVAKWVPSAEGLDMIQVPKTTNEEWSALGVGNYFEGARLLNGFVDNKASKRYKDVAPEEIALYSSAGVSREKLQEIIQQPLDLIYRNDKGNVIGATASISEEWVRNMEETDIPPDYQKKKEMEGYKKALKEFPQYRMYTSEGHYAPLTNRTIY
jgi:hypothetical protein